MEIQVLVSGEFNTALSLTLTVLGSKIVTCQKRFFRAKENQ